MMDINFLSWTISHFLIFYLLAFILKLSRDQDQLETEKDHIEDTSSGNFDEGSGTGKLKAQVLTADRRS
jgi:hypothetical protein